MATSASMLYGTTSKSGSVPNACDAEDTQDVSSANSTGSVTAVAGMSDANPVYSEDGRLILSESFDALRLVTDLQAFETDLNLLVSSDKFVEMWRIWDCYTQAWANIDLALYRFEMLDLVVRRTDNGTCAWQGAIDTQGRVLASRDAEENNEKCWQWLRV